MPKVCPVCGTNFPDSNVFCPTDGSILRAADLDGDLIGSVVADRYLVTDLLGEGGMGKVFLARHVRLPLQAAIKVLRTELLKDPAAVARFNREAANASSIEHERVARVFDFGETPDGLVYLAMEYINGPTLKKIINTDGPLSMARTGTIIRQVAEGLDAAHRMNIVHRDLKPDNILVQIDEENGDRCKVVDFGIAKAVGGDDQQSGLTQVGFVVGTPEFMSPEQVLGGAIDLRSDVFSLALVAFQCLTQDLPFDSNLPDRGLTARLVGEPRSLVAVRPDILWPSGLQEVFDHALQREPADRTPSAGAFAREFSAALAAYSAAATTAVEVTQNSPHSPQSNKTTPSKSSQRTPVASTSGSAPNIANAAASTAGASATHDPPNANPNARALASQLGKAVNPTPTSTPAITAAKSPSRFLIPALGLVAALAIGGWLMTSGGDKAQATNDSSNSTASTSTIVSNSANKAGTDPASNPIQQSTDANAPTGGTDGRGGAGETGGLTGASDVNKPATGTDQNPSQNPSTPKTAPDKQPVATHSSSTASSAVASLDSITKALDPNTADDRTARSAIPALRALLPKLPSNTDSTWTHIRIAEAYLLLGEQKPACDALANARNTARSMAQAEIINGYTSQLQCGP